MVILTKTIWKSVPVVETEFEAFDGKVFKDEKQCLDYEKDQKAYIRFCDLIDLKFHDKLSMVPDEVRGEYQSAFTFTFDWGKLSEFSNSEIIAYIRRLSEVTEPIQLTSGYLVLEEDDSNGRYVCIEYNYFQSNSNADDDDEWHGFFGKVDDYMEAVKKQLNTLIELDFITL